MELRQLQCLVVCAQTKSFSKAAAELFTTQSNVSKMIASFEKELGAKLFIRKQYGIELTEKGRQVYQYAQNMLDCSAKILGCAEEEKTEALRISFQPSSWFAAAFCDFYIQCDAQGKSFFMTSAAVDEIIRRLSGDLDQMGYAYIEEEQLERLQDIFRVNHIGYYVLDRTRTVLYYNGQKKWQNGEESSGDLPLIQGMEDDYSGLSSWKKKAISEAEERKPRVIITTNSDYIMQEVLKRTELSNISPEYLSHPENAIRHDMIYLNGEEKNVLYVCLFRNDRTLERFPKEFLSFIRGYLKEKKADVE